MFDRDEEAQPPTDGEQFEAVGRFEEPEEPGPSDLGGAAGDSAETTGADTSREVHPTIKRNFWLLAAVFNLALLGVSLGAILATVGDNRTLGGQVFLGGVALFVYGAYRYRDAKTQVEEIVEEEAEPSDGDGEPSDEDDTASGGNGDADGGDPVQ